MELKGETMLSTTSNRTHKPESGFSLAAPYAQNIETEQWRQTVHEKGAKTDPHRTSNKASYRYEPRHIFNVGQLQADLPLFLIFP